MIMTIYTGLPTFLISVKNMNLLSSLIYKHLKTYLIKHKQSLILGECKVNLFLWSSSWRLKFIHSQFPLPMALNSVLLKCQTEIWNLFIYSVRPTHSYLQSKILCVNVNSHWQWKLGVNKFQSPTGRSQSNIFVTDIGTDTVH
jgi:hypothetical protein